MLGCDWYPAARVAAGAAERAVERAARTPAEPKAARAATVEVRLLVAVVAVVVVAVEDRSAPIARKTEIQSSIPEAPAHRSHRIRGHPTRGWLDVDGAQQTLEWSRRWL